MNLRKFSGTTYFQPCQQILHDKMNPILKMLTELSYGFQAFVILWDEDFQNLYDYESASLKEMDLESELFENRFSKLNQEVIYVPNVKLHTLFQDIDFFKSKRNDEQLLIYPILDKQNHVKGIAGVFLSATEINPFDELSRQVESIGNYINHIYHDYLDQKKETHLGHFNAENLPASFFELEINSKRQYLYCNISKMLMGKHPAFDIGSPAEKRIEKILGMDAAKFYLLINNRSEQNIKYVYGCRNLKGEKGYFLITLNISETEQGQYKCVGVVEDYTIQTAYTNILDQIIFDISHVMRRPVVTMKGLTNLIDINQIESSELKEITNKIKIVSCEMEDYIKAMFNLYAAKQEDLANFEVNLKVPEPPKRHRYINII